MEGGVRVQNIQVMSVAVFGDGEDQDDCLQVTVDRPGDFSTYTLRLVEVDAFGAPTGQPLAGFDPRYTQLDFGFKAACPSDPDCKSYKSVPHPEVAAPEIRQMA